MAELAIRVRNLNQVRRALRAMGPGTTRALSAALKRVAQVAAADARGRVPRRSGRLAGSIRASARGTRANVGSRLPYAGVIEFGRKAVHGASQRAQGYTRQLTPQPYLMPAVQNTRDDTIRVFEAEMRTIAQQYGWQGR